MAKKYNKEQLLGPPPEPQGILGKAASVGLSGLQYAGNLLGVPGAVVKNTLGGGDPLAPILHPLSGEGRIEGRDLLRQNGLIGKKDTWTNWGLGTAVDIATDPLTYLAGGMTQAGKVARAAGFLDKASDVATTVGRQSGRLGATQSASKWSAGARTTLRDMLSHGDTATQVERMTHARNAASKMGVNLDDLLDQRLGGVVNLGIPGMDKMTIGASDAGANFLEGIGKATGAIPGSSVVGKGYNALKVGIKGLFNGPSGGQFTEHGQKISELAHEFMGPAKRKVEEKNLGILNELDDLYKHFDSTVGQGTATPAPQGIAPGAWVKARDRGNFGKVLSADDKAAKVHFTHPVTGATAEVDFPHSGLEAVDEAAVPAIDRFQNNPSFRVLDRIVRLSAESKNTRFAMDRVLKGLPVNPELEKKITGLVDEMVQAKDTAWMQRQEMGGKGGTIPETDTFRHFPRHNTPRGTDEGIKDVFRQNPTGHASANHREALTSRLYADTVNELGKNPRYRGDDLAGSAKNILNDFPNELGYTNELGEAVSPEKHAEELALHVSGIGKDYVEKSKDLFSNLSAQDWAHNLLQSEKGNASFRAIHEAINANLVDDADGIPLAAAFQKIGMDQGRALAFFSKKSGLTDDALLNAKVPKKLVDAATAVVKSFENPEYAGLIQKTLDAVNRYWKPGMILVKPAFWMRNHTSGQYANMVSGYMENPSDYMAYASAYQKARDIRLSADEALKAPFRDQLKVMGVMGSDSTMDANAHILGGQGSPMMDPIPPSGWDIGKTSGEVASKMAARPNPENPILNAAASATRGIRHKAGTWMETNAKANRVVEYQNRVPLYIFLTEHKGFSPEAAAKAVREVHFDYSKDALAPFERDWMQRLVPFYSFSKGNIPWTIKRLAEHPGGGLAQTIKAASRVHSKDELTPDYISETASVPWGQTSEGAGRYLTGFGLGFEDPASFAVPNIKQAGLEALSRTSPLIKGPLEYMTGQSFFQKGPHGGRDLEDLDPVIGRTLGNIGKLTGLRDKDSVVKYPGSKAIEHIASNSPLSGVFTALRTLTDPRKGPGIKATNLTTGLKFSDVSPSSQDRELMNRVAQIERAMGGRTFSISYMPKDQKAELSPQQQQDYKMLAELKRLLAERSKARKAAK